MENDQRINITIMGHVLSFDVWGFFVLGAATGIVALAGLQMVIQGLVRSGRRRVELRKLARAEKANSGAQRPPTPRPGSADTHVLDPSASAGSTATTTDQSDTAPNRRDRLVSRVAGGRRRREREKVAPPV
jgi:hypothetical protein